MGTVPIDSFNRTTGKNMDYTDKQKESEWSLD